MSGFNECLRRTENPLDLSGLKRDDKVIMYDMFHPKFPHDAYFVCVDEELKTVIFCDDPKLINKYGDGIWDMPIRYILKIKKVDS